MLIREKENQRYARIVFLIFMIRRIRWSSVRGNVISYGRLPFNGIQANYVERELPNAISGDRGAVFPVFRNAIILFRVLSRSRKYLRFPKLPRIITYITYIKKTWQLQCCNL